MLVASCGRSPRLRAAAIASSVLVPAVLAASALAALSTPESLTTCYGSLAKGTPTADQPNLMNYRFHCDGRISAYTIVANRRPRNFDVIDAFSTTADVLELMAEGRRRVHERFGVVLEPEVQALGEIRWPDGWELP